jgi:hypothetical protein
VARVFLAVWLAAFTLQTTEVLAVIAADTCAEDVLGSVADPCPEGCPRCVCCARISASVPQVMRAFVEHVKPTRPVPPLAPSTTPRPHKVFHVPKNS